MREKTRGQRSHGKKFVSYFCKQRYWYDKLECDVSTNVVDTTTACNDVYVSILQAAQVVPVSFVQKVVGGDVELGNLLAFYLNICPCREAEQGIARRLRFCIVGPVDMRLLQIAVKTDGDVEVVEE